MAKKDASLRDRSATLASGDAPGLEPGAAIDIEIIRAGRIGDGEGLPTGGAPDGYIPDPEPTQEPPLEREPWSPPASAKRFPWARRGQSAPGERDSETAEAKTPPSLPPSLERGAQPAPEAGPRPAPTAPTRPAPRPAPRKPASPEPAPLENALPETPLDARPEAGAEPSLDAPQTAEPLSPQPEPARLAETMLPAVAEPGTALAPLDEEQIAEQARLAEEAAVKEAAERAAFIEENSLGSLLFGARATAGKHDLKEVERDLKIKARYLKAIEEVDPENLPSEAYLAGYVKTYAAYLKDALFMTPDEALAKFRRELAVKKGLDPDAVAKPEKAPAAPQRVSAKVAPTIARKVVRGAPPPPPETPAEEGADGVRIARKNERLSPAEALRARAEAARSEQTGAADAEGAGSVARARRAAARSQADEGEAATAISKEARREMQRKAMRVAEAQRVSRAASGAGPDRSLNEAVGPLIAAMTAIAVIGGLSYGAYSLLSEAQRVTAPGGGERALTVVERLDPAADAAAVSRPAPEAIAGGAFVEPGALASARPSWTPESPPVDGPIGVLDRRPAPPAPPARDALSLEDALADVDAVLGAGDPMATATAIPPGAAPAAADPAAAPLLATVEPPAAAAPTPAPAPKAAMAPAFGVVLLEESWFRIIDGAGEVVISRQLPAGEIRALNPAKGPYELRTGNAGGLALVANNEVRGPLGERGAVADVTISPQMAASLPILAFETEALRAGGSFAAPEPAPPLPAALQTQ